MSKRTARWPGPPGSPAATGCRWWAPATPGEEVLEGAVGAVVAVVAGRRATYGRRNLLAEAHRLRHGVRFA